MLLLLVGMDLYGIGAYAMDAWNLQLTQLGLVCQFRAPPINLPVRFSYRKVRSERFLYGGPFDSLVGYERFWETDLGIGSFLPIRLSAPWFLEAGAELRLGSVNGTRYDISGLFENQRGSALGIGIGLTGDLGLRKRWFRASLGLDLNLMTYFNPAPPDCWYYLPVPNSGAIKLTGGIGIAL